VARFNWIDGTVIDFIGSWPMAASDYTDMVARFSDQLAAETLANVLASIGIRKILRKPMGKLHRVTAAPCLGYDEQFQVAC